MCFIRQHSAQCEANRHREVAVKKKKKMNLLGYTYRIYNSGYNTENIN